MKAQLLSLILATVSSVASAASDAVQIDQLPIQIQQKVDSIRADLESKGFEVGVGHWNLFSIEDCKYPIAKIGNCLGNNPTAPYIVPTVPLWPDEFVEQSMKDFFGPTKNNTWWTYRMDPREAMVVIGMTPPDGAYYGLQSYVFTREGKINTKDEIYKKVTDDFMRSMLFLPSPNPARTVVFSSIGDSINNVTVQRQSGASFNQERSFIITADAVMERQMTEALLRAGVQGRENIFTEKVSSDLVQLGLQDKADDMVTLVRYALPANESLGSEWRQKLPLAILRVRDKNTMRAVEPYAAPVPEKRTVTSELGLKDDLNSLVSAVKQKWQQSKAETSSFQSLLLTMDLVGAHCLKRPQNCLGDSADADYQISETEKLDANRVLAVVGTLATETGNATYTSLSVNQIPALKGVANLSQKDLAGSALAFAGQVRNAEKFYVHYFARHCGNLENCFEVSDEMVPASDGIKFLQRNYVLPGSARGPNPEGVLNPVLLVLKHTPQSSKN